MRLEELRDLIRMVEESEIEELEISNWGKKVKISKKISREALLPAAIAPPAPPPASTSRASTDTPMERENAVTDDEMDITDLVPVKSPMVGTFYAAPAPDADPFVRLGDNIRTDQVVCIVEAMKLMNEIRAESDGRIVKILVENGEPVEFGQTLFLLTPA